MMKRQGPHNAPRIASGVREGPGSVSSSYFRITLGSASWPFPSLPTCRRARRAQNPAGPADRIQAPSLREGKSEPQLELSMAGSRNCRGEAENPVMLPQNRWVPSGSAAASGSRAPKPLAAPRLSTRGRVPAHPQLTLERTAFQREEQ